MTQHPDMIQYPCNELGSRKSMMKNARATGNKQKTSYYKYF